MSDQKPMKTLSQVMETLRARGIVEEFRMNEKGEMRFAQEEEVLQPEDMQILRSYRFEGDSSPDDNAVLYVVKDKNDNLGMIIDSYGAESNYEGEKFDKFIRAIPVEEDDSFKID